MRPSAIPDGARERACYCAPGCSDRDSARRGSVVGVRFSVLAGVILLRSSRPVERNSETGTTGQALRVAKVILVDTNALVNHLRKRDPRLVGFLLQQRVRTCDVVIGELMLGSGLPKTFADDLLALPSLPSPSASATRAFIERHRKTFAGSGIGWADAQIVIAAATHGARVHSTDRNVRNAAHSAQLWLEKQRRGSDSGT